MIKRTISIQEDGIEENEERIGEIREALEDLEEFAEGEYEHEALRPERLQNQVNQYEQEIKTLEGRNNIFEKVLEEWEGDEFEIRMLKGSELAQLQDVNGQGELGGEQSMKVIKKSITDYPEGAEEDPGEHAWPITVWLFQKVNSLNGTGDPNFMDGGPL